MEELSGYEIKTDFLLGDKKTIKQIKLDLAKDAKYLVFFKPKDDITYPDQPAHEILVGDSSSLKNFMQHLLGIPNHLRYLIQRFDF